MIDFSFSLGAYENLKRVNSEGYEFNFLSSITDNFLYREATPKQIVNKEGISLLDCHKKKQINFDLSYGLKNKIFLSFFYNGDETDPRGIVKSWVRSDVNFSREVRNNIRMYLRIKNIFDENYQDIYGYGTEERSFNIGLSLDIN